MYDTAVVWYPVLGDCGRERRGLSIAAGRDGKRQGAAQPLNGRLDLLCVAMAAGRDDEG